MLQLLVVLLLHLVLVLEGILHSVPVVLFLLLDALDAVAKLLIVLLLSLVLLGNLVLQLLV